MSLPFDGLDRVTVGEERVPINIHPDVRKRLHRVLWEPEFRGVDYSAFIERACEIAETEIAERRTKQ